MKLLTSILALFTLIACACGTAPQDEARADYSESRFVEIDPVSDQSEQLDNDAPDPLKPITVYFVDKDLRYSARNPIPGLEPMPFGQSMFGPWDTGSGYDCDAVLEFAWPEGSGKTSGPSFVQKKLSLVLHYIALNTPGLQVVAEGETGDILVTCVLPEGPYTLGQAITIIESICKANLLDIIVDGEIVIVKMRERLPKPANVSEGKPAKTYNVSFKDHAFVDAIMEVAAVAQVSVFVPARTVDGEDFEGPLITLELKDAAVPLILGKLAVLGGMDLTVVTDELSIVGYYFRHKK